MKVEGAVFHGGYGAARAVARTFSGIGWAGVGLGALICLAGFGALSSFGVIGVVAGIGMAISGALLVMQGQVLRANVDAADYARQTFALVLAQARGLPEADLRAGADGASISNAEVGAGAAPWAGAFEQASARVRPAAASAVGMLSALFAALRDRIRALSPRVLRLVILGAAVSAIVLPVSGFLAIDNARYCQGVLADPGKTWERLGALFSPSRATSAAMFSDPVRPFPIKLTSDAGPSYATLQVEAYDAASGVARVVIPEIHYNTGGPIRLTGTMDANGAHLVSESVRLALTRQGDSLVGEFDTGTRVELDLSNGLAAAHKQSPAGGCEDPRTLAPVLVTMDKAAGTVRATEAHALNEPPYQIIDRDLCPGEGCEYGIEWRAKTNLKAYGAPPERIGSDRAGAESKVIGDGQWLTSVTGLVLAKRGVGRIERATPASERSPALAQGQLVAIYSALGEGCYRSWINGMFGTVCDVAPIADVPNEHWVEFRLADGSSAWSSAYDAFISRYELNDKLAQVIANNDIPLNEKLKQMDAMLKDGAQMSGSGGKYGMDPTAAVFSSNDVELMKASV